MRCLLLSWAFVCVALVACADDAPPTTLTPIPRTERLPRPETRRLQSPMPAATQPAPPAFIIGVWYPPAASMPVWKARGVNTVIGYEHQSNQVSIDEWSEAAVANGLFMIRQPRPNIADDLKQPNLLALMQIDEPDLKKIEPPGLIELYADWKKEAPKLPVFLSVSGGGVLFRKTPRVVYEQYLQSADWIGNDFYPVSGWNQPTWIPRIGHAVELCRTLSGGKPQFAFVETSSQQLAWMPRETRGVTPEELRAEIWDAIIHGVKGIIYFPQQFNPFVYDATPSNVSVELAKQNRLLADLAAVLSLPANPKGTSVTVKPPLEAGWRLTADGELYIMVLNTTPEPLTAQTVKVSNARPSPHQVLNEVKNSLVITNNEFKDDFSPWGAHIYQWSEPTQPPK